jgi:hypothetical protein
MNPVLVASSKIRKTGIAGGPVPGARRALPAGEAVPALGRTVSYLRSSVMKHGLGTLGRFHHFMKVAWSYGGRDSPDGAGESKTTGDKRCGAPVGGVQVQQVVSVQEDSPASGLELEHELDQGGLPAILWGDEGYLLPA